MANPVKGALIFGFLPCSLDAGLLMLRVLAGGSLFMKHGWEKLSNFSGMAQHFQDPIHIGPVPSLAFALFSDAICSLLLVVGLGTRWASLFLVINIGVAWSLVHHFAFFAKPEGDHGEVCFLYIAVFLALFFTGAGRYSADDAIRKGIETR